MKMLSSTTPALGFLLSLICLHSRHVECVFSQEEGGAEYSLTPYHRLLTCLPRADFSNCGCLPAPRLARQAGGQPQRFREFRLCLLTAGLSAVQAGDISSEDIVRWTLYVGHRTLDIVLILATYPVAALDVTVRNQNQTDIPQFQHVDF